MTEPFSLADTIVSPASIHELVLRRVRLLSQRRIAWLRRIWAEIASQDSQQFNSHVEVDGYLSNADIPSLEKEWLLKDRQMADLSDAIAETEDLLFSDSDWRLTKLVHIFDLSRAETDILHLCLASLFDPNLGRVFAYMQDHSGRAYATETLVARLFGHGQCLLLNSDTPLKAWNLVKETIPAVGEPARLECDPYIKNWVLGLDGIDESLVNFASFQTVKKPLSSWPVEKAVDFIKGVCSDQESTKVRIFVSGPEGSGRRSFAAIVSRQLGLTMLTIQTDRIPESRWQQIYTNAQRQAFLSNSALAWHGENMQDRFWPQNISSFDIQFVIMEVDGFIQPENGFVDLRIELPPIFYEERLRLWQEFVPLSAEWPKEEFENLILRYETTIGQIVSIGKRGTRNIREAYAALRSDAAYRLGNLAQQMNGSFDWEDLVLSGYVKKGLEDFAFEATERIRFWEEPAAQRLFSQGRGLIALFTGSPGTGKTMAAQVIATSLKLDLFRIDLSSVMSKYIGESSKNIERILSRAKSMNIVLLFDEADSLFGKRTEIKDAHDRYANTDTNYLLQAIEQYPGVIILASNKKSNIDNGFMRRFRYLFEFPKPDAEQRLQLWRRILTELSGDDIAAKLDEDLVRLAGLVELTGAQIKLSVLSGLFMARRDKKEINLSHLLKSLERELIKEGRGLGKEVQQSLLVSI